MLPNFHRRIMLHSHLVMERSKTVTELYEKFTKFSKLEVLHFRKLKQQRKAPKYDEASRLACYNDSSQHNYPKPVHNIDFDGCRPLKNWKNNFWPPLQERSQRNFDHRSNQYIQRGGMPGRGRGHDRGTFKPLYCMYHDNDTNHRINDCPIFLDSKRQMEQDCNHSLPQSSSREVNNTMQWSPPHHQYSPSYPSLFLQTHPSNSQ
jgi:hypothetical protein